MSIIPEFTRIYLTNNPKNDACKGKHHCCVYLVEIAQVELHCMKDYGIDPLEYTTERREVRRKLTHGFTRVRGPYRDYSEKPDADSQDINSYGDEW